MPPRCVSRNVVLERGEPSTPSPPQLPPACYGIIPRDEAHAAALALTEGRYIRCTPFAHRQTLAELGILDQVAQLLTNIGLQSFLDMSAHTHPRLTIEFLSSYSRARNTITFRLMDATHSLTIKQINEIFGWPTDGTIGVANCSASFPDFDPRRFWEALAGNSAYRPAFLKSCNIAHPVLRMTHRIIFPALFYACDGVSISKQELFWLWAMTQPLLPNGRPVVRFDCASWFTKNLALTATHLSRHINCGGLITLLATRPPLCLPIPPGLPQCRGFPCLDLDCLFHFDMLGPGPRRGQYIWLLCKIFPHCILPSPTLTDITPPVDWSFPAIPGAEDLDGREPGRDPVLDGVVDAMGDSVRSVIVCYDSRHQP